MARKAAEAPVDINTLELSPPPDTKYLARVTAMIDKINDQLEKLGGMIDGMDEEGPKDTLALAATHYRNLYALDKAIEEVRLKASRQAIAYQNRILPDLFHNAQQDTVKTLNGYTVSMSIDLGVSIPEGKKDAAYQWLIDNGLGDIITSTVNSSTLKSVIKDLDAKNLELPADDIMTIRRFPKYSVRGGSRTAP